VTNTRQIRATGSWYLHGNYGYTHQGQLLGAVIGPGSNLQAVDVSRVRGINQVGLRFERLVHNDDFANRTYNDYRNNWVDAGFDAHVKWRFSRILARASLQYIHAYTYPYNFSSPSNDADYWDFDPHDRNNLRIRFG